MKTLKAFSHPFLLIASFLLVLISGEHFGGFYAIYLLMALPHGGIHAILGSMGIILLIFGYYRYKRTYKYLIEPLINVIGAGCLIFSFILFFSRDKGYNDGTFEQLVPQISLILFGALATMFVISNVIGVTKGSSRNSDVFVKKV